MSRETIADAQLLLDAIERLETAGWSYSGQETLDSIWDELANYRSLRSIREHIELVIAREKRNSDDLPDHNDGVPVIP